MKKNKIYLYPLILVIYISSVLLILKYRNIKNFYEVPINFKIAKIELSVQNTYNFYDRKNKLLKSTIPYYEDIKIGDSVSKKVNSSKLYFYRKTSNNKFVLHFIFNQKY